MNRRNCLRTILGVSLCSTPKVYSGDTGDFGEVFLNGKLVWGAINCCPAFGWVTIWKPALGSKSAEEHLENIFGNVTFHPYSKEELAATWRDVAPLTSTEFCVKTVTFLRRANGPVPWLCLSPDHPETLKRTRKFLMRTCHEVLKRNYDSEAQL